MCSCSWFKVSQFQVLPIYDTKFWSPNLGFVLTSLDTGLCKSHHNYAQRKWFDVAIDCTLLQQCTTDSQWFVCMCEWSKIPWAGVNFSFFFFLPNNININWNIIRFTATVVIFSLVLTQPPMWFKVQNAHLPDESYVGVLLYYVNCTNCKTHTVFYFFLLLHLSSNMRMHVDWNFVYVSIFSHIMFVSRERQCNIPTKQQQGSDKMIHNTMHIITGRLVLGGTGELLCRTR